MTPYTRILCPIDFSELSLQALAEGAALAARLESELVVLHVVAPVPVTPGMTSPEAIDFTTLEENMREAADRKLAAVVEESVPDEVACRAVVLYGTPADEIVEYAEKNEADLVAIASHGMSGWRHYVFGSVTQKVIQRTDRSVLVVRPKQT